MAWTHRVAVAGSFTDDAQVQILVEFLKDGASVAKEIIRYRTPEDRRQKILATLTKLSQLDDAKTLGLPKVGDTYDLSDPPPDAPFQAFLALVTAYRLVKAAVAAKLGTKTDADVDAAWKAVKEAYVDDPAYAAAILGLP